MVVSDDMVTRIILNAVAQRKTNGTTAEEVRLFDLQQYVIHLSDNQMLTINARIQYNRCGS